MLGIPFGEICGEQKCRARSGHFQGRGEKFLEVPFHTECFAGTPATESGRVENDGIERLPAFGEAAEVSQHILGDEAVLVEWKTVEFKIPPTALEEGFRNIHAGGFRAEARGGDGKGAGVGEGVEKATGREFSKGVPVRALVAEKAGIVAGVEINLKPEGVFEDDLGGRARSVALE